MQWYPSYKATMAAFTETFVGLGFLVGKYKKECANQVKMIIQCPILPNIQVHRLAQSSTNGQVLVSLIICWESLYLLSLLAS